MTKHTPNPVAMEIAADGRRRRDAASMVMTDDKTAAQGAYVGIDSSGISCAGVVDRGNKDTADAVAGFIRDGLTVERTTVGMARSNLFQPWPWSP